MKNGAQGCPHPGLTVGCARSALALSISLFHNPTSRILLLYTCAGARAQGIG